MGADLLHEVDVVLPYKIHVFVFPEVAPRHNHNPYKLCCVYAPRGGQRAAACTEIVRCRVVACAADLAGLELPQGLHAEPCGPIQAALLSASEIGPCPVQSSSQKGGLERWYK